MHAVRCIALHEDSRPFVDGLKRSLEAARCVPDYESVRRDLRAFVEERDWDRFHAPKDLALSVAIEAGELAEIFQWRDARDLSAEDRQRVGEELADVTMYCMLLADKAGLDLMSAIEAKLVQNRAKYPVDKARGKADKYDRL
jgi:NTP pyrophosphatase (non-canonical NTP hydrolase)